MLTTYFKHPFTLQKLRSGPAGLYLDDYASHLTQQGYSWDTARRHLRAAGRFSAWAQTTGLSSQELGAESLEQFKDALAVKGSLRYPSGVYHNTFAGTKPFVAFLQATGRVSPCATAIPPALRTDFSHWMQNQRGVTVTTLDSYCRVIDDLLQKLGDYPEDYTAHTVRAFTLDRASRHGHRQAASTVTAIRMFIRFLIAHGRCQPTLLDAIPSIASWRQRSLPSYLRAEEIERLLATCKADTPRQSRDRAVLLLLARLGLRARDITTLTLRDIEWDEGTFRVRGKNRHETRLPLPQEVGEAIWTYIQHHRPTVPTEHVFITTIAPLIPINSRLVSTIVAQAIQRAGLESPVRGAHLLRHSAATAMLRQGVSLESIGAVLRHRSMDTTMIYTKVDTELLRQVIMPWVEDTSCSCKL
jgi:site-specific recombinase XerD